MGERDYQSPNPLAVSSFSSQPHEKKSVFICNSDKVCRIKNIYISQTSSCCSCNMKRQYSICKRGEVIGVHNVKKKWLKWWMPGLLTFNFRLRQVFKYCSCVSDSVVYWKQQCFLVKWHTSDDDVVSVVISNTKLHFFGQRILVLFYACPTACKFYCVW